MVISDGASTLYNLSISVKVMVVLVRVKIKVVVDCKESILLFTERKGEALKTNVKSAFISNKRTFQSGIRLRFSSFFGN